MSRTKPERSFSIALREAVEKSNLTLSHLAEISTRAGAPVTQATLSYWLAGRSQPRRRSSLEVVVELERALNLEPGLLVEYLAIDRDLWRYQGAHREAISVISEDLVRIRQEWGIPPDDRMRRDYFGVETVMEENGGGYFVYELVLTLRKDCVPRLLITTDPAYCRTELPTDLVIDYGATLGRICRLDGGALVHELVLDTGNGVLSTVALRMRIPLRQDAPRPDHADVWALRPFGVVAASVSMPATGETYHRRITTFVSERSADLSRHESTWEPWRGGILYGAVGEVPASRVVLEWTDLTPDENGEIPEYSSPAPGLQ